jgi:RimJ/RimL family protein N-acetyltransferase
MKRGAEDPVFQREAAGGVEARLLEPGEREVALAYLKREARANLFLLDLTERLGLPPPPGEMRTEIVAAWRHGKIVGVAGLRPSVVLDARVPPEAVEVFLPHLEAIGVGLVKSAVVSVDLLWSRLGRDRRRHVLVDRIETAYAVRADQVRLRTPGPGEKVRPATEADLDPLVVAARESLREERRPDPFAGDPKGFRRWVRGRIERARVVETEGRIGFAAYADVRRPDGWLLQGVYTWPELRRRGLASCGVSALCREAFAAGAEHVQLAVVDDNRAGRRLYECLGFEPFAKFRTILFT